MHLNTTADRTLQPSYTGKMLNVWDSERNIALLLFVVALLLYLPGIWWGLPHATTPNRIFAWGSDELAPLGPIAELYSVFTRSPKFNPQYPLFQYIVEALFVGPYVVFLWLTGGLTNPSVVYPFGLEDPVSSLATMALLARCANLLMAAGVVVVTFKTASMVWDRRTGVLAALLALSLYPMFYYARTSNVDMGMLFWTSLGLLTFAACLHDAMTTRRAAWLGTFAALATATKDPSYAVFLPLALVIVPHHLRQQRRRGIAWLQAWKAPFVALFSSIGVYLVASGFVFHPQRFLAHVSFITRSPEFQSAVPSGHSYYSTPATLEGYLSLVGETGMYLADTMGLPMLVCALAGLVLCMRHEPKLLALALPVLGIMIGVILPVRFVRFRFLFVAGYVLVFFAAVALAKASRARPLLLRRAAPALIVIVLGWALIRGADLTYQMINDPRHDVGDWLQQHARPGDELGYYDAALKLPPLEEHLVAKPMPGQVRPLESPELAATDPEFIVVIPQLDHEPVHEWTLPKETYEDLKNGTMGYEQILGLQAPSLFSKRPISYVNPPVKLFVRKDYLGTLPNVQPIIEVEP